MKVRRRIYNKETGKTKTVTEVVELIKQRKNSVIVKLENGDIIKRKLKDVVEDKS